jgi:hypothetical protein
MGLRVRNFLVGQTTLKAASSKMGKHEKACSNNQHVFIRFTFNTFGLLATVTLNLLKRVQNVIQSNVVSPKSMNVVFQILESGIQKRVSGTACCSSTFF